MVLNCTCYLLLLEQEVEESKLFRRRQVLTNWDRYEESERALEEDDTIIVRGADFSQLLNNAGKHMSECIFLNLQVVFIHWELCTLLFIASCMQVL